jgi:hypothetical protein
MILHGGISHSGTRVFAIPSDLQGHVRVPDNDIDHAEEDESASESVLVLSSWQPSYVLDPGGNYPAHTAAHTVVGADILDPIDAALDQPPELVADTDSDDEEVLQADGPRRTAHGG